ncbi:Ribosomal protein S18 acetylase RimI [Natronoarchaeum philippinense]|uniref:Ribosomal protein S18 acetylase RimI n=1 Tax=Natronoarchaeum philippinense TaxID=558529 RepID=A0A285NYH6_NATPI|nr:GNAT family N-acetyltransferase [Natronoarchaeum philippinense]SNZ12691.1 Ribosomal protein S18 acetylase RimI [Natronoarchaeum philippinense]
MSLASETYEIRRFERGDAAGVLELYETVFGEERTNAWFDWKYRENPAVDHVPITVAVDPDDGVVGARPLFALPMAAGEHRFLAVQPGDTMVHPDHRRQGLFTRMTERAIERYDDHEVALFFNFPNEQSGAGYRKLGWRDVGEVTTYYRIQSPSAWLDDASGAVAAGATVADLAAAGYHRARDAVAPSADGISVDRYREVPVTTLVALYRGGVPAGFHAVRSEQYLRWRFQNPRWTYRTYVARDRAGEPLAAAVVGRKSAGDDAVVRLTDALPPVPEDGPLVALLDAVLSDADDAAAVAAPSCLPETVLSRFGFHPDTAPPLSLVSSATTHVARPATVDVRKSNALSSQPESGPDSGDADDWTLSGRSVTDPDSWTLTFGEQDTS